MRAYSQLFAHTNKNLHSEQNSQSENMYAVFRVEHMSSFCIGLHKNTGISWYFESESFGISAELHVTQHVTVLWSQILLYTKGSLLGVHVCQNEGCHQVNDVPLQVLSTVITLTAKVFITHTQRCFSSANSSALTLGFSNGWGMCHDMGSLVWGNVHVSSNIWFHGRFRCLGRAACGCLWTF